MQDVNWTAFIIFVAGHMLDNDDYDAIVDAMERTRGAMFSNDVRV